MWGLLHAAAITSYINHATALHEEYLLIEIYSTGTQIPATYWLTLSMHHNANSTRIYFYPPTLHKCVVFATWTCWQGSITLWIPQSSAPFHLIQTLKTKWSAQISDGISGDGISDRPARKHWVLWPRCADVKQFQKLKDLDFIQKPPRPLRLRKNNSIRLSLSPAARTGRLVRVEGKWKEQRTKIE